MTRTRIVGKNPVGSRQRLGWRVRFKDEKARDSGWTKSTLEARHSVLEFHNLTFSGTFRLGALGALATSTCIFILAKDARDQRALEKK